MKTNRLIHEKSPYLLQHANNPVDWYPWSEEAFARARKEDKPIFLSIGYATCHWCHVMERESFEDAEAAAVLNETFISIKVDREERPDIDAVYMAVCQMLTGRGGWPLTIMMTPDRKPFFAATYIPKRNRQGQVGLIEISRQIKKLWKEDRGKILDSADGLTAHLQNAFVYSGTDLPDKGLLATGYENLKREYDREFGGFGNAPKFPTPHRLLFLLRQAHRKGDPEGIEMVKQTLIKMRLGGIWDHVGFGFHRYSTDRQWLLPHFEKMLYDQALLVMAYLEAYQLTGEQLFSRTVEEIITYLLRDMTSAEGGFFAAEDADSEGEEGKFYIWSEKELRDTLSGLDPDRWVKILNLTLGGNFAEEATGRRTGENILHLRNLPTGQLDKEWLTVRKRLFDSREKRPRPLRDDKVLTDWNGLMITALADAARILERKDYEQAAVRAADFLWENMRVENDRLLHRYREGEAGIVGMADDYAFFTLGLLSLYRTTLDPVYLERAKRIQNRMIADFWDEESGGFFLTSGKSDPLPARPKEVYDGALPSSNSIALLNLMTLSRLTGNPKWENRAEGLIRCFSQSIIRQPGAFTFWLLGFDIFANESSEVVIVGKREAPDTREMLKTLNRSYLPTTVVLLKTPDTEKRLAALAPFTESMDLQDGKTAVYICKGFACGLPIREPEQLRLQLVGKNPKGQD